MTKEERIELLKITLICIIDPSVRNENALNDMTRTILHKYGVVHMSEMVDEVTKEAKDLFERMFGHAD